MKSLYRYPGPVPGPTSSNPAPWRSRVTFEITTGRVSSPFGIELQRSLHAYADGLAARIDDGEQPVTKQAHRRLAAQQRQPGI